MMANFPLALSIEPSLLPYARANGFRMDHKASLALFMTQSCAYRHATVSGFRLPENV